MTTASSLPIAILIHGWSGKPSDWDAVAAKFHRLNIETMALEIPGHPPDTTRASVLPPWEELVQSWAERWRGLNRPLILLGYSMGGRLALALSAHLAPQTLALGLLSSGLGFAGEAERRQRAALDESRAHALRLDPQKFWQDWYAQPIFRGSRGQLPWDAVATKSSLVPEALAQALVQYGPSQHPHLAPLVKNAKNVLYLFGELDTTYAAVALEIAKLNPQAQIAAVAGAGHALLQECPAICAERLVQWLRSLGIGSEVRHEEWTYS